jgi:RNA polymerase sigma-70 factor (ECF subfamily)
LASLDINWLFRRHGADLLRFLRRRVDCPEAAADIAQESFARLLRAAPSGELADPRAYLFTAAANLALDHRRHQRVSRVADDSDAALAALPDSAPSPETIAADRERLARAMAAMAELPERTRIAFEMHRLGGMTQTEIARELGVSVTVVWRMIHAAYAHLRDRLREADEA